MKELFAALVQAQAEIGSAVKDKTNPHFKSKYADLASVVDTIKPVAAKFGLGFVQTFRESQGGVTIETVIIHKSGESYATGPLFVPATKQDAQGYGSAITYGRRYGLQTAFGVPSDDDDGNAATASAPKAGVINPVRESFKNIDADPVKVAKIVSALIDLFNDELTSGLTKEDWSYVEQIEPLTQDERIAVWNALAGQSKIRARVKKAQEAVNGMSKKE